MNILLENDAVTGNDRDLRPMAALHRGRAGLLRASLGLLMLLGISPALAQEAPPVTFTALFKPNALDPSHNRFVNTTPNNGFCPRCTVSVQVGVSGQFRDLEIGVGSREGAFFKIPSTARTIPVLHEDGVTESEVTWRASSFATRLAANGVLDGFGSRSWVSAPAPCSNSNYISGHAHQVDFQWNVRAGAGGCAKAPVTRDFAAITISRFSIGYELTTPNPLSMKNGIYRGSIQLSVGPGGDFDFGDRAVMSATSVTFSFELTVEHEFKVEIPSGSDRALLTPVGGWSPWVDHGRVPTRLQRELPFQLTSSGEFSVKLECQYPVGDRCGIRSNLDQAEVPVDIDITMPGMHDIRTGAAAVGTPLTRATPAPRFGSSSYVSQRPSRLMFSATGDAVSSILAQQGSHWRGDVTIVFDANP